MKKSFQLNPACRSRRVVAVLVSPEGEVFVGSNGVERPQASCPRKARGMRRGQGWELCRQVCAQPRHAEADVLSRAGEAARGSVLYILGHDCACEECRQAMREAGVARYVPVPGEGIVPGEEGAWPGIFLINRQREKEGMYGNRMEDGRAGGGRRMKSPNPSRIRIPHFGKGGHGDR